MFDITRHQEKAYKNHSEILLHHQEDDVSKKKITSVDENVEKLETSHITGWNIKWHSCFGKQCGGSLKG